MTPQELKNSILQLAIQGKLVEQRPEEGTVKEWCSQNYIGQKTSKKEASEIKEEDKKFDIPESWEWFRIGTLCNIINGFTPLRSNEAYWENPTIPWFTIDDIRLQGRIIYKTKQAINRCALATNSDRVLPPETVLLCCTASVGEYALSKIPLVTNQQFNGLVIKDSYTELLSPLFLFNILPAFKMDLLDLAGKTTFNYVSVKKLSNLVIPIPPRREQTRIVAKIEELLPFIDRYEQAWNRLEAFNKRFPEDIKKSILQLAIQGKLVEQHPEEGTGEVFYQQIQTEKQRLIKTERIKNGKPLPEITETEKPFEIPESWKWVRLSDIISTLGDGIHGTPIFDDLGEYYFINGNNLVNGRIEIKSDTKKVSVIEYEKYKKPLGENTILLSINGTIGNIAFYAGEPVILGKSACYFSLLNGGLKEYICHLLHTDFFTTYAVHEATQTTIKNVSLKAMRMLPVPLPPLAEQKRIVARLEELLPLCDKLK